MKLDVTEYIDTLEHYRSNFEQVRDQFEQVLSDLGNYESEMGEAFVGETGDALREKVRQSITDFRDNYFLLEESMQYAICNESNRCRSCGRIWRRRCRRYN